MTAAMVGEFAATAFVAGAEAAASAGLAAVTAGLAAGAGGLAGAWALAAMVLAANNRIKAVCFMAWLTPGGSSGEFISLSGNSAPRQHPCQQGGSGGQMLDHDGLVAGVRTF